MRFHLTHILQPADVSVFKPLKQEWKTTVRSWLSRPENVNSCVNKLNFCTLFEETLKGTNITNQIKNGFRKCGLFPLNPENVDYTKCVKDTLQNKLEKPISDQGRSADEAVSITDLETAKKVIGKIETQLYGYGINVEVIYNELNELLRPKHKEITVGSVVSLETLTNLPEENILVQSEDTLSTNIEDAFLYDKSVLIEQENEIQPYNDTTVLICIRRAR